MSTPEANVSQGKPRDIAEELLHSYCETLYFYDLALEHKAQTEPPSAFNLFETIFDLMGVPSREEFHRLRIPNPNQPSDYWTRDELVKEFHRIYDDPSVPDDGFVRIFLDLLEKLAPGSGELSNSAVMAQA